LFFRALTGAATARAPHCRKKPLTRSTYLAGTAARMAALQSTHRRRESVGRVPHVRDAPPSVHPERSGGQRTARPTRDRVFRKQRPSKKDGKRNRTCVRLKMRRRQPQISDDAVTKLNIGWKSAFHSPDICRVHACRQGFGHGYGSGAMWQLKSFVLRTCNPSRLVQFTIKTSVAQPATCRPPIMSRAMRASRLAVCNCLL